MATPHGARHHASTFALELLADNRSTTFDRSVIRAIYQIGCRDNPDATAAEWALLHLSEHLLELGREQVSEPIGAADHAHGCGSCGAPDLAFKTPAHSIGEPVGSS
jgi:hypothetical protein